MLHNFDFEKVERQDFDKRNNVYADLRSTRVDYAFEYANRHLKLLVLRFLSFSL